MATVDDVEVANASFPNVRQDLNDILEAITTNFSADTEPTTTYPNQFWYETDTNLLYVRNEANDAWITLASIDQTSGEWEPRTAVIQAIDAAGLSFKTDEGTTRVEIADDGSVTVNTSLDVDNIKIDGNTISSTDTNGDINITPDGTGKVVIDGLNYPTADGSDGQVLTTDGAGNIAFEDAGGAGKVLQFVHTVTDSEASTSSTSFVDSGFSITITPTQADSTIFIMVNGGRIRTASSGIGRLQVRRDTTEISPARNRMRVGATDSQFPISYAIADSSHNTTSAITYRVYFTITSGTVFLNNSNNENFSITAMEIAG